MPWPERTVKDTWFAQETGRGPLLGTAAKGTPFLGATWHSGCCQLLPVLCFLQPQRQRELRESADISVLSGGLEGG